MIDPEENINPNKQNLNIEENSENKDISKFNDMGFRSVIYGILGIIIPILGIIFSIKAIKLANKNLENDSNDYISKLGKILGKIGIFIFILIILISIGVYLFKTIKNIEQEKKYSIMKSQLNDTIKIENLKENGIVTIQNLLETLEIEVSIEYTDNCIETITQEVENNSIKIMHIPNCELIKGSSYFIVANTKYGNVSSNLIAQ